ncbi:squalene synthase 1-like [Neltuma alba]|uniref:squalene synthase 1-like n=1 Tax=Neltuma alba TaxID=207710 RepID=UPI0010A4B2E9|nr:squalene synthase 1-like [Prosopis alba]
MASLLGTILKHPEEIYPMLKMKMVIRKAEKVIPDQKPHWVFCYTILHKVARNFALTIQHLDSQLRDSILVFYLVLRALDTVEDDTSLPSKVRIPILETFHLRIADPRWSFSCGTGDCKILMEQFHHVRTAFLELKRSHQDVIREVTRQMGAGMAKFICKEIETIEDLNEYAHYVAGLVGLGLSKLFYASGTEDLAPESLSNSMGLLLQNANIIRDYLEDINEIPMPRTFWPRQVWSKYVHKLEDLKEENNSKKALQCLNEMVTNALVHVPHCLKYLSALRDPAIFRFCAVPQVVAIGTLALCYNNIDVFRVALKLRRGLTAKLIHQTRTMSDVYDAFSQFTSIMKAKVEPDDPSASTTLSRIEAIQQICKQQNSKTPKQQREHCKVNKELGYHSPQGVAIYVAICLAFAYLYSSVLNIYFVYTGHLSQGVKENRGPQYTPVLVDDRFV